MAERPDSQAAADAASAAKDAPAPAAASAQAGTPARSPGPWWQIPALVAAVILLGGGVITAWRTAPRPDPEAHLARAATLLDAEQYEQALQVLNGAVRQMYQRGGLTLPQQSRFHLMRARAVYLGQQRVGLALAENFRSVIEEYAQAARASAEALSPRDLFFLADAHVAVGEDDRALELAAALPDTYRSERSRIVQRIVLRHLDAPGSDPSRVLRMLATFLTDPLNTSDERAWALARQAEILVRQGQHQAAITRILQLMPGLIGKAGAERLGDIYLILGQAYLEAGDLAEAGKRLDQAASLLGVHDPARARALVWLGRIEEQTNPDPAEGQSEARARYLSVLEQFGGSAARLPALLGLGEVEAAMQNHDASLVAYQELVQELNGGLRHPDVPVETVTASLLERWRTAMSSGQSGPALAYARLAERLHQREETPVPVLLALAQAHRQQAEEILNQAGTGDRRLGDLARLDPGLREEAREHLEAAGAYFKRHADAVVVENNLAYGESLWQAADSYDLAGFSERAIPLFDEYARVLPGDARRPEALFRLAQAWQARGEYETAAEIYRRLRAEAAQQGSPAGPLADASVVPLAQCLLLDALESNDAEAQELLEGVVRGLAGGPATPHFRDGLLELARLRIRRGEYAAAIAHLEEILARFPDDPRIDQVRFELADACRRDAHVIRDTLAQSMPERDRQALEAVREQRLRQAQALFEEVRQRLEARDPRELSALERLYLRNSCFYVGDCAFDLGDYESAIRLYDAARERYPDDPASLVAMIQIVNAYVDLGDMGRAATANERARRFYESLPPTAWDDPTLPMTRREWAQWLDSLDVLLKRRASAPTASEP